MAWMSPTPTPDCSGRSLDGKWLHKGTRSAKLLFWTTQKMFRGATQCSAYIKKNNPPRASAKRPPDLKMFKRGAYHSASTICCRPAVCIALAQTHTCRLLLSPSSALLIDSTSPVAPLLHPGSNAARNHQRWRCCWSVLFLCRIKLTKFRDVEYCSEIWALEAL